MKMSIMDGNSSGHRIYSVGSVIAAQGTLLRGRDSGLTSRQVQHTPKDCT